MSGTLGLLEAAYAAGRCTMTGCSAPAEVEVYWPKWSDASLGKREFYRRREGWVIYCLHHGRTKSAVWRSLARPWVRERHTEGTLWDD